MITIWLGIQEKRNEDTLPAVLCMAGKILGQFWATTHNRGQKDTPRKVKNMYIKQVER